VRAGAEKKLRSCLKSSVREISFAALKAALFAAFAVKKKTLTAKSAKRAAVRAAKRGTAPASPFTSPC
jgi:hypothetical protein